MPKNKNAQLKSKNAQLKNAQLRDQVSNAIFPILRGLGVQAALSLQGAFALHRESQGREYMGPRKLCIVVEFSPGTNLHSIRDAITSRSPLSGSWTGTGPGCMKYKDCKLRLVLSGGDSPKILENFTEVVTIAGIPVLPVHAILLHKLLTWPPSGGSGVGKGAEFIQMCLDAVGQVRLNELSPLWQSTCVLQGIREHVLKRPNAKHRWVALGVDPSIFEFGRAPDSNRQTSAHVEVDELSEEGEFNTMAIPSIARQPPTVRPFIVRPAAIADAPAPSTTLGYIGTAIVNDSDLRSLEAIEGSERAGGNVQPPRRVKGKPTPKEPKNIVKCDNPVVDLVARDVIPLLKELGFDCAIFGSTACQLYGNTRMPGDLDVLVLPPASFSEDQEWLKRQIANRRPSQFKLKKGKAPGATYHVLYYKLGREFQVPHPFKGPMHCKVDILLPGIMHLPYLTTADIVWKDHLPIVPFLTLLLQKLQGWGDHLASHESHKFKKHPTDARDIHGLLSLVPELTVMMFRPWRERNLMSEEFQAASAGRVTEFCRGFPSTKSTWCMLGFEVE